jgi:hypothetical protein
MPPKLSQVCLCWRGCHMNHPRSDKHLRQLVMLQEEFDDAVKTNIEDFDMEVC